MKKEKPKKDEIDEMIDDLKNQSTSEDCEQDCECGCNGDLQCEDCKDEEEAKECIKEDNEKNEYLEMAQRIQAEFDNYRKRNIDAVKEAEQRGMMKAVEKILPVFDSINSAKKQVTNEEFKTAIDTLHNQLLKLLEGINVKKIDAVGLTFDPNKHNAVLVEECEGVEPDTILEEFQEGFELNGKVIRHSVVKVSK